MGTVKRHKRWIGLSLALVVLSAACSGGSLEREAESGVNAGAGTTSTDAAEPDGEIAEGLGSIDSAASSAADSGRSTVPDPPTGWKMVFQDGFDLKDIDSRAWTVEHRAATNMGEISFYARDEVSVRDGRLLLQAQRRALGGRQFTTAQVSSKFALQYGRVDIRAKMPMSQGFWPALWMLPSAGSAQGFLPEIDIHESISNHGGFYANFHWKAGAAKRQLGPLHIDADATEWHVYSIEWTESRIAWLVDDREVAAATEGVHTTSQSKMYLLITFALGGSWPGPPDQSTVFPSAMEIDWVRMSQR